MRGSIKITKSLFLVTQFLLLGVSIEASTGTSNGGVRKEDIGHRISRRNNCTISRLVIYQFKSREIAVKGQRKLKSNQENWESCYTHATLHSRKVPAELSSNGFHSINIAGKTFRFFGKLKKQFVFEWSFISKIDEKDSGIINYYTAQNLFEPFLGANAFDAEGFMLQLPENHIN